MRAARRLKALDPQHPLVIIQAPRSTVAQLAPYRPAFDITGADIFPIAYPPGEHSDLGNKDISVVGDVTRKMVRAAGGKPVWMTLQIAWSGTVTSARKPNVVPRFPTRHELRFMAYQAIVAGARGLMFFGGHLTQASRPADAEAGLELDVLGAGAAAAARGALVDRGRPGARGGGREAAGQGEREGRRGTHTRRDGRFLYVLAVRRGGATSRVGFTGPAEEAERRARSRAGRSLFEYAQEPPPPPIGAGRQVFRSVSVAAGGFRDWLGPHDARVYRFAL